MKQTIVLRKKLLWVLALLCVSVCAVGQEVVSLYDEPAMTDASPMLRAPMFNSAQMSGLLGDVNIDGMVDVGDVTALIKLVLNNEISAVSDINSDGFVDVGDVTALIQIVLNGNNQGGAARYQTMLNDVYRSMRKAGWSTTGNTHQCFGIMAY